MNAHLNFFNTRDRFALSNGIRLIEIKPGFAKAAMDAQERHLNGVNIVQGGALFTLADLAFGAAANSHGTVAVALNVNITFLKAGLVGDVFTAEAVENSLSPKIGSYTVEIKNGKGELVAIFQGTAYRKKESVPF